MILPQAFKTILRDYRLVQGHTKALFQLKWLDMKKATVGKVFDEYATKNPEQICFYFKEEEWTFKRVYEMSNQVGNYFAKEGLQHKDVVALLGLNRPEYVCVWLGLSKIGVVTALINYNLRAQPLQHSLEVAKSKAVICETPLTQALTELGDLPYPIYVYGESQPRSAGAATNWKNLDALLPITSTESPKNENTNFRSPIFYCYTSGTTGLPKAAVITHSRFFMASYVNHYATEMSTKDIIYMTLPLYHVAGGMLALSQTLIWGNPLVIRDKFSATAFWKDCIQYKVTVAQYIAETCRYLLQTEKSEYDRKHNVKIMFGNGFRKDIWPQFIERFGIEKVVEYYASTEGNANLVNYDNTMGAVGVIPNWLEKVYPIALVRVDEEGEIVRDEKTGRLIRCKPGEVGELIGLIVKNSPLRDFKGYADDKEANEKRTVRNVFKKGDAYFRTGDLLYKDDQGYHFFSDRMGETFRWKSENVSTAEVEGVISQSCSLRDVIVFGVKIPGYEGSAGMAVIADPDGTIDIKGLEASITKTLPHYARPVFIRITKEIPVTGTHKLKKTDFVKEGYDLSKMSGDKLYVFVRGKYTPLTEEINRGLEAIKL